ncbi:MAG: hypothetical protein JRG96_01480 [Deltaproteobacteria bacterium]|nr:hypothetical protein [Deltaproteobacteria bacterium]MBW2418798.1 hypothetical protein [Deltaproteobacteria bacterium]
MAVKKKAAREAPARKQAAKKARKFDMQKVRESDLAMVAAVAPSWSAE